MTGWVQKYLDFFILKACMLKEPQLCICMDPYSFIWCHHWPNFSHITIYIIHGNCRFSQNMPCDAEFFWGLHYNNYAALGWGSATRARKSAGKKPVAAWVRQIKLLSCFTIEMANRIATFSTLRFCIQERITPRQGQPLLFAKLSDSFYFFKLLIND